MHDQKNKEFGSLIMGLINKENLTFEMARSAFSQVLGNEVSEMHQGAFLAALVSKGETGDEIAGGWGAVYDLDTNRVDLSHLSPLVENSGTGMDTFKTFNISTAASVIAASSGIHMARHGARAITSRCGTVDMAEALGVDVECSPDITARSVERACVGLFNGMSPQVHPQALGRILSQICFGSSLNIAASLANPAMPKRAVRGVYARELVRPVAEVMKKIGYERAIVIHGEVDGAGKRLGMDEASVCGDNYCAELKEDGSVAEFSFCPSDIGFTSASPESLSPSEDINVEAKRFVSLIRGEEPSGARIDTVLLNTGLISYIAGQTDDISGGVKNAREAILSGAAYETLENWVAVQSSDPAKGLEKLHSYQ